MAPPFHLVSNASIPGFALPDGKCVPCSEIFKSLTVTSYSHQGSNGLVWNNTSSVNNFQFRGLKRASFACKAISNNSRKNPDFSRQNKGFSKGRTRRHQNIENSVDLEETDLLNSKNGPLPSLSSNPRYQATATPGRREKEIVELFRKVQKQLRERAAIKEEKKIEASQQGQGERGTVESLLKLLRKHSMDQKKKTGLEEDFNYDQSERSDKFEYDKKPNLLKSSNINSGEVCAPEATPVSRPTSNFRRKSPVARVKFRPIYSAEDNINSQSSLNFQEKEKNSLIEPEPEPLSLDDVGVLPDDPSDSSDTEETCEEILPSSDMENTDLNSLKLSELRDLARSRGLKGYSKLKKGELIELLSQGGP